MCGCGVLAQVQAGLGDLGAAWPRTERLGWGLVVGCARTEYPPGAYQSARQVCRVCGSVRNRSERVLFYLEVVSSVCLGGRVINLRRI
jgi:hypothetical protein